jgi:hypothetical protein
MFCRSYSIHHWIAELHIFTLHVDASPQDTAPRRELTVAHSVKEVQVFSHGAISEGTIEPRLSESPSLVSNFVAALVVYIRETNSH